MYFGIDRAGRQSQLTFLPWISWPEYRSRGVLDSRSSVRLLTVLPTLVLTRKYLKV